ncbi:MAG: hypothetical protein Faunusvirus1_18 [Faunusvirus sp.]|jgi:hypothetical protein|uniref:Uncharacterized protein n=1 Tax=Faunusvirus sp. TaxID=2487766 RepID=A0A3G4ZVR9_9VIRU|nr:MAG: hypothetical protein Faunusvirus1_18 [Faunusvirus sp.]
MSKRKLHNPTDTITDKKTRYNPPVEIQSALQLLFESNKGDIKIKIVDENNKAQYITVLSEILKINCPVIKTTLEIDMIEKHERIIDMTMFASRNVMIFLKWIYYRDAAVKGSLADLFEILNMANYYDNTSLIKQTTFEIASHITMNNLPAILAECEKYPAITDDIVAHCGKYMHGAMKYSGRIAEDCYDLDDTRKTKYCCKHTCAGLSPGMVYQAGQYCNPCFYYIRDKLPLPTDITTYSTRYCCEHRKTDIKTLDILSDWSKTMLFNKLITY